MNLKHIKKKLFFLDDALCQRMKKKTLKNDKRSNELKSFAITIIMKKKPVKKKSQFLMQNNYILLFRGS